MGAAILLSQVNQNVQENTQSEYANKRLQKAACMDLFNPCPAE